MHRGGKGRHYRGMLRGIRCSGIHHENQSGPNADISSRVRINENFTYDHVPMAVDTVVIEHVTQYGKVEP